MTRNPDHLPRPVKQYQQFLSEGRFMLQRSRNSGRHIFHPRVAEPVTGDTDLEWVEASGEGVVYSTTVIRQRPPAADYNIALIDLAEGPRIMSRVEGVAPEDVRIGMAVIGAVVTDGEEPLVIFRPKSSAASKGEA